VHAASPFWNTPQLRDFACFGSAERCAGRSPPLSPFLDAAFDELVHALDTKFQTLGRDDASRPG
jgi:hypothetical protein